MMPRIRREFCIVCCDSPASFEDFFAAKNLQPYVSYTLSWAYSTIYWHVWSYYSRLSTEHSPMTQLNPNHNYKSSLTTAEIWFQNISELQATRLRTHSTLWIKKQPLKLLVQVSGGRLLDAATKASAKLCIENTECISSTIDMIRSRHPSAAQWQQKLQGYQCIHYRQLHYI